MIRRIGAGSYGSVYEGQHRYTGHPVAIKVLDVSELDDHVAAARRFFREAAATSRLSHPNTVRVFDFGQADGGQLFLVMERLEGSSVSGRLRSQSRRGRVMSVRMAAMVGVGALASLGEAHANGLIHRDIKGENIFLHRAGPDDLVIKVLDFGIARDEADPITMQGTMLGTPTHMSPEQVASGQVDARSDLYSLGVVLYECLTGDVPFDDPSPMRIAAMHVIEELPPIGSKVAFLEGTKLAAVVERALAKRPEDRWQTAVEMRSALLVAAGLQDLYLLDSAFKSSMLPSGDAVAPLPRVGVTLEQVEALPDDSRATLKGSSSAWPTRGVAQGVVGAPQTGEHKPDQGVGSRTAPRRHAAIPVFGPKSRGKR